MKRWLLLGFCLACGCGYGAIVWHFPSPWWHPLSALLLLYGLWQWRAVLCQPEPAGRWEPIVNEGGTEAIKAAMRTLINHPTLPLSPDQMLWLQTQLEACYPVNPYMEERYQEILGRAWIALLRRLWVEVSAEYDADKRGILLALMECVWEPPPLLPSYYPYEIGNRHCAFNARSAFLRCAVHPDFTSCEACRDYKPRK